MCVQHTPFPPPKTSKTFLQVIIHILPTMFLPENKSLPLKDNSILWERTTRDIGGNDLFPPQYLTHS